MRIVLTGATGLLGRNLLFEILKQNLHDLNNLQIFVLGRSHAGTRLDERIKNIIVNDGLEYIANKSITTDRLLKTITAIPFDLTLNDLGITVANLQKLKAINIDLFFHLAALSDFRSDKATQAKLNGVNTEGTRRIIDLVNSLKTHKFIYVGSAYSCGSKTGLVEPDYVNIHEVFRNPYEESKLRAEILVREYSKGSNTKTIIFRPSTISGRLIEQPIGRTNKFDVFYGWAAFFLKLKMQAIHDIEKLYSEPSEIPIRLFFNPRGGLNIVPVDYAAKVMLGVSVEASNSNSYHLANKHQTPNQLYGDTTFEALNISGYKYVLEEPKDKNRVEELYYRTVGKIFTPYGISEEIIFNTDNLNTFEKKHTLSCPQVNKENYLKLLHYAMNDYFGVLKEKKQAV